MNVINSNPIIQSYLTSKPRSSQQAERENIKLNNNVSNKREAQSNRQNETVRVIRVAPEGLKVAEFGNKNPSASNGQSSLQRKPTEQYQTNQQLSDRESIAEVLGVDFFA